MFIHESNRRVRAKMSEREEPIFSSVPYQNALPVPMNLAKFCSHPRGGKEKSAQAQISKKSTSCFHRRIAG